MIEYKEEYTDEPNYSLGRRGKSEREIWTTSEVRFIPIDIYTENNNVNIYVDFAEMNKPPRKYR